MFLIWSLEVYLSGAFDGTLNISYRELRSLLIWSFRYFLIWNFEFLLSGALIFSYLEL